MASHPPAHPSPAQPPSKEGSSKAVFQGKGTADCHHRHFIEVASPDSCENIFACNRTPSTNSRPRTHPHRRRHRSSTAPPSTAAAFGEQPHCACVRACVSWNEPGRPAKPTQPLAVSPVRSSVSQSLTQPLTHSITHSINQSLNQSVSE